MLFKEDEMGRACVMHGRCEKSMQNFLSGNLKGKDHLGDLGISMRVILKWMLNK
jgi:hypothetical protein